MEKSPEMDEELFNTVKCVECKCILQSALILPCYNSVCAKHVDATNSAYFCTACNLNHLVPTGDGGGRGAGFKRNNAINLLIERCLGNYKRAHDSCLALRGRIADLDALSNEPESQIDSAVRQLREEIVAHRRELIREVEQRADAILDELDVYQMDCKMALKQKKDDDDDDENGSVVEEDAVEDERGVGGGVVSRSVEQRLNELLDQVQVGSSTFEATSRTDWKSILEQSEQEAVKLRAMMDKVRSRLLLNKFDEFKVKQIKFSQLKIVDIIEW